MAGGEGDLAAWWEWIESYDGDGFEGLLGGLGLLN